MKMNTQEVTLLVMLDLSATFDTINHKILLTRLNEELEICGSALEWFKSYLVINHRSLVCATCGSHYHLKCGDVKPEEFIRIQENTLNWVCGQCTFKPTLPFASLSNTSFLSSVGLVEQNTPIESSIDVEPTESHLGDLLTSLDYSPKCMRIAHINICSLRNKLDELRVLQELCKFDIIGITESHLNTKDYNSELNIDSQSWTKRRQMRSLLQGRLKSN